MCFRFIFDIESHCETQTGLELTMQTSLASALGNLHTSALFE